MKLVTVLYQGQERIGALADDGGIVDFWAGGPRPGAQAGPPKPMQQPAGAIHQDAMQDPNRMPR